MNKLPKLCTHKPSGRAFVTLNNLRVYLGKAETAEAQREYARVIQEWLAAGRKLPTPKNEVTLKELTLQYLDHCAVYYRDPDGKQTTSYANAKQALRVPLLLYGPLPAVEFSPLKLKTCLASWIEDRIDSDGNDVKAVSRAVANRYRSQVVSMFKWASGNERLNPSVWHALQSVEGLRYGRTSAREREPVLPVDVSIVEKTKKHLPKVLQDAIDIQLLSGARPSEILQLTPTMIDQSGDVWIASPPRHKTRYAGKVRTITFGPKAQTILRPYLLRGADEPLFNPAEGLKQRRAKCTVHRRPNQKKNETQTDRKLGDRYTIDAYRRAITRAVAKANEELLKRNKPPIPTWAPNQLRHTRATELRKQYGIDTAAVILGHSKLETTEIYAEQDREAARRVMSEVG